MYTDHYIDELAVNTMNKQTRFSTLLADNGYLSNGYWIHMIFNISYLVSCVLKVCSPISDTYNKFITSLLLCCCMYCSSIVCINISLEELLGVSNTSILD